MWNPLRWLYHILMVDYRPDGTARAFLEQAQQGECDGRLVRVAVLDGRASRRFFGVPLSRRSIQPVWIEIENNTPKACRLQFLAVDPHYYSPLEAAAACHWSGGWRLVEFGALAWLFTALLLPLIGLVPVKLWAVRRANRRVDQWFREHAFPMRPIEPGKTAKGFVYGNLTIGTRVVLVRLLSADGAHDCQFSVPVAGLDADHVRSVGKVLGPAGGLRDIEVPELRMWLEQAPAATTNGRGLRAGDPANLVVIGDFPRVLAAFGAGWDETEVISLATCWKTTRAFLTGSGYRYSPVSGLYLFGRSQDFALQRIRDSINRRLHLRLWATPLAFHGQPVWFGQVSRDIGVRFTWRAWNLMTHRIDPDVDEARDYVVEDLLQLERLEAAAYVDGVPACTRDRPLHNLTGDPWWSDGKRAVVLVSAGRTAPRMLAWFA